MRLIDADALYRKVKAECNPYGKPSIGWEDGQRVMQWIEQTPTVCGWISVKDRLPGKDGEYLVYVDYETIGYRKMARFSTDKTKKNSFLEAGYGWSDYDSEYGFYECPNVTHWQYLPEPPEVKDDE